MVLTDRAGLHRRAQLRKLRRHLRTGQRTPRPNPRRQLEPARDLSRRDAQPRAQHPAHRRDARGPVRGFGDLAEEPIHQTPVRPLLSLQPLGHLDAELVAHHLRTGLAQHVVRGIDGIQLGTDALPRPLGAHARTHTAKLESSPVNAPIPKPRGPRPVDETPTVDKPACRGVQV
jgi:hypothetical protein